MRPWIALAGLLCLAAGEPPRPVRVVPVVLAPVRADLVVSGTVQARVQADLAFRVGGKILARPVEVGDLVRAGQVLARLDPADLVLAEQAAEASVQAALADATIARAELGRYERLGAGSPAYVAAEQEKRAASSKAADARLAQLARQLSLARSQRSYGELAADADGVVTALPVQLGQVVGAGQTVATVARMNAVEVVADVPENRIGVVRPGEAAEVTLWAAPDRPLAARVREVGALADPASRTFQVRVGVPDAGTMRLGMTATVRFGQASPPMARLPGSALSDQGGRPAVWVLDASRQRAALRPVQVAGYGGDGSVLVAAGLAAGELVITAGVGQVAPDMALVAWPGAQR